jgi:hypothetical protein
MTAHCCLQALGFFCKSLLCDEVSIHTDCVASKVQPRLGFRVLAWRFPGRGARGAAEAWPSIGLGQKELAGHLRPFLVGHMAGQVGHGHAAILGQSAQRSRHQPLQAGG